MNSNFTHFPVTFKFLRSLLVLLVLLWNQNPKVQKKTISWSTKISTTSRFKNMVCSLGLGTAYHNTLVVRHSRFVLLSWGWPFGVSLGTASDRNWAVSCHFILVLRPDSSHWNRTISGRVRAADRKQKQHNDENLWVQSNLHNWNSHNWNASIIDNKS